MKNPIELNFEISSPALTANSVSAGKYSYPQHIAFLDSKLMQVASGSISRLIVNMPPRHGKSELISKYFPFWYLGLHPDKRIILSSYEATFAQSWGRKVRNLISEFGNEYFGITLSDSSHSAGSFDIENHNGGMSCVGAGGPITGKGADLFIIDDPIKNDEEANSALQRDKLWDWFRSTAYTRLEPDGAMIIMMTRWHEDDLCGRVIDNAKNEGEVWELVSLPSLANDGDLLGREVGEALWGNRFSREKLLSMKRSLGSYWFDSLYQQNPVSADGGIFKKSNFRYFYESEGNFVLQNGEHLKIIRKDNCSVWSAVDLAISLSQNADYTCVITVAISNDRELLVLDVIRKRISPSEHLPLLQLIYENYQPRLIGIEAVQYQSALVSQASAVGLPVKALKPESDKLTRALPVAAMVENGKVYFNRDALWLKDLESELIKFPRDKHDDQVDALSYAASFINSVGGAIPYGFRKRSDLEQNY